MQRESLLATLLDLSFTSVITPRLARLLYIFLLLGSAISGLTVLVSVVSLGNGFIGKAGGLVGGAIAGGAVTLVSAILSRVSIEVIQALFRGVEDLDAIRDSVRVR